jgi:thioredoxin 1
MKPMFEKFQDMVKEKSVEVIDIDVDENPEAAQKYGVRSIPFTVFEKDGQVVKTITGMRNSNDLYSEFQSIYEN